MKKQREFHFSARTEDRLVRHLVNEDRVKVVASSLAAAVQKARTHFMHLHGMGHQHQSFDYVHQRRGVIRYRTWVPGVAMRKVLTSRYSCTS